MWQTPPHLIERFTALFDAHHMNIAELVSRTQPAENERAAQLHIQITAHSPASADAANIEQVFKALCTELNAQGSINVVNYSNMMNRMELCNESYRKPVISHRNLACRIKTENKLI